MEYINFYLSTALKYPVIGTQRWQYNHFKILRSIYTLNYLEKIISFENYTNRIYTHVLGAQQVLSIEGGLLI